MKKIKIMGFIALSAVMLTTTTGCNSYMMRAGIGTAAAVTTLTAAAVIDRMIPTNYYIYANGIPYQVYGQCDQNGTVLSYFYAGNSSMYPIANWQNPSVVLTINPIADCVWYDQGNAYPVYAQCGANGVILNYGCYSGRSFRTVPFSGLYRRNGQAYRYGGGRGGAYYGGGVHY